MSTIMAATFTCILMSNRCFIKDFFAEQITWFSLMKVARIITSLQSSIVITCFNHVAYKHSAKKDKGMGYFILGAPTFEGSVLAL